MEQKAQSRPSIIWNSETRCVYVDVTANPDSPLWILVSSSISRFQFNRLVRDPVFRMDFESKKEESLLMTPYCRQKELVAIVRSRLVVESSMLKSA